MKFIIINKIQHVDNTTPGFGYIAPIYSWYCLHCMRITCTTKYHTEIIHTIYIRRHEVKLNKQAGLIVTLFNGTIIWVVK